MLWLTHAYIVFDRVEETISKQQQVQIAEWLTNWSDNIPASTLDTNGIVKVTTNNTSVIQTNLYKWLHPKDVNIMDDNFSEECSYDCVENTSLIINEQRHYNAVHDRKIVADGTHQCDTTNTCLLVR
jgi:hypothetical protein